MIGVFDSGLGGLTVLRALARRFPSQSFCYLGDHANVPYGDRPSAEIVALTSTATAFLFDRGCRLVLLGCNTATAVAARHMQQVWMAETGWRARGHNVLGIVAPTVEAATQTPWAVTTPQYPQKYNQDTIVVFGTNRTIGSHVYREEISKRCPRVTVIEESCPGLAGAIESRAPAVEIEDMVAAACRSAIHHIGGRQPERAILGCTHFPLVEDVFCRHLPPTTRLLSQPDVVADSLEDYLARHPNYAGNASSPLVTLLTTGDTAAVDAAARVFWPDAPDFTTVAVTR